MGLTGPKNNARCSPRSGLRCGPGAHTRTHACNTHVTCAHTHTHKHAHETHTSRHTSICVRVSVCVMCVCMCLCLCVHMRVLHVCVLVYSYVCACVTCVCTCVTCVRACMPVCACVTCVCACVTCVCVRACVLQLSDLSQVDSECTKCAPHSAQWSAQKPQMCAPHSAERGSQGSAPSLSGGRTVEWSARSARKGAETATHTPPRLVQKTSCGEKLGMGKEPGERMNRGHQGVKR